MAFQYTPYALPLFLAAALAALLAYAGWRRRPGPGVIPFVVLMLGVIAWSLTYILELTIVGIQAKSLASAIEYVGITTVPAAWLAFALEYTGREKWLTRRNIILLAVEPVATLIVALTNRWHGAFWVEISLAAPGMAPSLASTFGPLFWVHAVYSYLILLLGTLILIQAFIRSPQLYRGQVFMLLVASVAPWIANALYISGLSPFSNLDITPFSFLITGSAMGWSIYRYRLFDIVPVARDAVIENMDDIVIVIDEQNRVVDANPSALRLVGQPASAVIGEPFGQFLAGQQELIEQYREVEQARAEVTIGENENQRHFDLRISPVHNQRGDLTGRLIVLHDITPLKQASEALRESEERYRSLFEATFEAVVIHDGGTILDINQAFETIFGYSHDEAIGKSIQVLVVEESRDVMAREMDARTVEPQELIGLKKNSRTFDGEMRAKESTYRGQPVRVLAIRDISDRKGAERQIQEQNVALVKANRELAVARRKAEEATRLKSEFLATMSHELRTPLNAIMGYSQIFLEGIAGDLTPKQRENQERILANAKTLTNLIDDVLDLAKIEAGRMEAVKKAFILRDWLDEITQQTETLAQGKGLSLKVVLDERMPERIVCDPDRLRQITLNLIANAIKFTDEGYVQIEIQRQKEETWSLAVSDTGIGIPSHAQEYIFDEFRQVDGTVRRRHGGTGLGLAIVRNLTMIMGGSVRVKSQVGEGSTFTVILPLAVGEAAIN